MAQLVDGKVVSTKDDSCAGRIKVIIKSIDNDLIKNEYKTEDLEKIPWCLPLLPKMINVIPKVDEIVKILLADGTDSARFYIGPLISQPENMFHCSQVKAESFEVGGRKQLEKSVCINGVDDDDCPHALVPRTTDVAIEGRKNTGVQLTDNNILIKCGVKNLKDGVLSFNKDATSSYVLLKYNEDKESPSSEITPEESATYFKSFAGLVADKIAILGNRPTFGTGAGYDLCDKNELITEENIKKIIEEAQQLPLGNKLVEFLILFVKAFLEHTHPCSMLPPYIQNTNSEALEKYVEMDSQTKKEKLYSILSDNVRIN